MEINFQRLGFICGKNGVYLLLFTANKHTCIAALKDLGSPLNCLISEPIENWQLTLCALKGNCLTCNVNNNQDIVDKISNFNPNTKSPNLLIAKFVLLVILSLSIALL